MKGLNGMRQETERQHLIKQLENIIEVLKDDNVIIEQGSVSRREKIFEATEDGIKPISAGVDLSVDIDISYENKRALQ